MLKRRLGRSWRIGVLAILCIVLTGGCGSLSPNRKAEHKIADALPELIGPAKHYDVKVDGDAFALARGRARRITVHGVDVQATPDLTLTTLDFTAENVRFDMKTRQIDNVGSTKFTGTFDQDNLNRYLAQSHAHPDVTLALRSDDIALAMPISIGPIHTTVRVVGQASPTRPDGNSISFVADSAHLSILPVPAFLVNRELARINPVVDLSRFKIPIALESTRVKDKKLVVTGTADLTALTLSKGAS